LRVGSEVVGDSVGLSLGSEVVGDSVGLSLGFIDGDALGLVDGDTVGSVLGAVPSSTHTGNLLDCEPVGLPPELKKCCHSPL